MTDSLGCTDQKTIMLNVSENPVAGFHGAGTIQASSGYIHDSGYVMESFLWNTGETTDRIAIYQEGLYVVEVVSKEGCTGIDSV